VHLLSPTRSLVNAAGKDLGMMGEEKIQRGCKTLVFSYCSSSGRIAIVLLPSLAYAHSVAVVFTSGRKRGHCHL